jgi:hypothetical protein
MRAAISGSCGREYETGFSFDDAHSKLLPFVPAKAGTQGHSLKLFDLSHRVRAFAGTNGG